MGVRETGGKVSGGKATGAQVSQETGGKGDKLMSEREPENSLPPSDKAVGQNVMEGIHRKSYSESVIEGVVGDSIVRKTDRVLNKGDDLVVCLPEAKIEAIPERICFSTPNDGLNDCLSLVTWLATGVKWSGAPNEAIG
ncbi:hypothetical protein LSAT2_007624 [Lamellibrachia satsuma]|nr:hypothetical protein LSAT2_007624 [Lamellibrachia satsuma]